MFSGQNRKIVFLFLGFLGICGCSLVFPANADAATYFVSLSGSDSNAGTSTAPFRTFTRALTSLQPGDSLQIYGGTYHEALAITKSGTASQPITIQPVSGQQVLLDAQNTNSESQPPLAIPSSTSYVKVQNLNITRSTFECVLISGSNITLSGLDVYNCRKFGYRVKGSYITIENSQCRDSVTENSNGTNTSGGWGSCLKTAPNSHHLTIKNNHVFNNWGEGIIIGQAADSTVFGNRVHDNFSQNIYIGNSYNIDVFRNVTYSTNPTYYRAGNPANCISSSEENISADWGARLSNIRVFNNLAYGCKVGVGYTYSEVSGNGCDNCLFAYNTLVNTEGIKIIAGPKNHVRIVNNIVQGGSLTLPGGDVSAEHNLIGNAGFATTPTTNPATYSLSATSPAINQAIVIADIGEDFVGSSRGNNPDLGAFEYGGTSTLPTLVPTLIPSPTLAPSIYPTSLPTLTPSPIPSPLPTALSNPTALPKPGDFNSDGGVNEEDVGMLLNVYGRSVNLLPGADLNHDNKINAIDYAVLTSLIGS